MATELQATPPAMAELRIAARAACPDGLLDLSRSEPLPIPLSEACAERVAEQFMRARQYSPSAGLAAVRDAAARYASARTGLEIDSADVTITAGAMAGLAVALRALIEPGDEVLVPVPYFHSYPKQVSMLGGVPRLVDARPRQGELTPEAIERELTPRTRALLLCNPSNPAGAMLDRERLAAILAVLPPEVAVIADEVYAEYVYGDRDGDRANAAGGGDDQTPANAGAALSSAGFVSVLAVAADEDAGREVVALDTASKTAAMPGWRVGTATATPGLAPRLAQAAATLSGAPNTLAQLAFAAWLDDPPRLDRMAPYRPRLRDVLDPLTDAGLTVRPPDGTYYVWVTATEHDGPTFGSPDTALELARRAGVLVWPGALFGDLRSVRVSLGVPRRELRDGVRRLTDSWREVREGDVPISRPRR
ncbi:MAG TPA: pyridoxal phosphate-dependent aminotransferase [Thermoleophilaceae bacterium]|nr:pyridoxal phosphate-dependent aminotransferase [Thermoleophilaceae bacterium]